MTCTYNVTVTADIGKILPEVGELAQSVSKNLRDFGMDEDVRFRAPVVTGTLRTDYLLSAVELRQKKRDMLAKLQSLLPDYDLRVDIVAVPE